MFTIWLVSFFALELSYWYASGISLAGAALTYGLLSAWMYFRTLKKHQLNIKEYRYIRKNLEEAKRKMDRMRKALVSIRNITFLKDVMELLRIMKKIYQVTKKEPKRFYLGEKFYFSHLDSAVELTEKYALLSSQPNKDEQLVQALHETRHTIKEMKTTIENDLYHILSDDIEQLHFELDVTKYTLKSKKNV